MTIHPTPVAPSVSSFIEDKNNTPDPSLLDEHEAPDSRADRGIAPVHLRVRLVNLGAVLLPVFALAGAIWLSWGDLFDWTQAAIFFGMSTFTAIGVTVGYHRLFTHRSFETVAPVRVALAALGSMAVQGPVIQWVGEHRRHHQHSDSEEDPHSPHQHEGGSWGDGFIGTLRGFFHAHVGWLFASTVRGTVKYTRDLRSDPLIRAVNRQFVWWVIAGLIIPAALGGLISWSWQGALLGFLWGGLVRVMVNHHITWSVNSVCHLWGSKPFRSGDESRNNAIVGILAMGEGWHNNHHAFPTSARHGLHWWQFDASYWVIKGLEVCGLAWKVRVPAADRIAIRAKSATPAATAAE